VIDDKADELPLEIPLDSAPEALDFQDIDSMVQEAEQVLKSNGSEINLTAVYNIEFTEGRTRKDGNWIKTGKFYWIYTTFKEGKRVRISPTKIHGNKKFLTRIENCPHKGRVASFYRNRTAIRNEQGNSNGYRDILRGLQNIEGTIFDKSAGNKQR